MGDERNRQLLPVAWDCETWRMRAGLVAPPIVCISYAHRDETGALGSFVVAHADGQVDSTLDSLLNDTGVLQILCNAPYDLTCAAAKDPSRLPSIFQALEDGRIHDVSTRERLLNLAEFGSLDFVPLPDGTSSLRTNYSLPELENYYLGWDRAAEKEGDDALRVNYEELYHVKLEKWPRAFVDYPKKDAEGPLLVWECQEKRRQAFLDEHGFDPLKVQDFRVALGFALRLITCQGFPVDPVKTAEIERQVEEQLAPERLKHLLDAEILVPPKLKRDGTYTNHGKDKLSNIKLHALIVKVCEENGIPVVRNELTEAAENKGKTEGSVKADKEVLEDLWTLSPILEEYRHRQNLLTLKNKELPPYKNTTLTWSGYLELGAESGRTSCRTDTYFPSDQIQNLTRGRKVKNAEGEVVEEIDIRQVHVARPGWVLYSCDYSSIEFMSVAQKCYELFGFSRMRELLLAGVDPHAHLGSRMAYRMDDGFRQACDDAGLSTDEEIREAFLLLKKSEDPKEQKFFAEYRQFAKPAGFGFWGGLGAKRFCAMAKKDYGITVSEETAKLIKEITKDTYPEMGMWFEYVEKNLQTSPGKYGYFSPLGMWIPERDYTDVCNGAMLQTPATGDGATLALFHVVRACYDDSASNPLLYGTHVLAFLHDEIVGEVPIDGYEHERAHEVARIMIDVMKQFVMKDVPVNVEPALMKCMSKNAKSLYDENKRLIPWSPAA